MAKKAVAKEGFLGQTVYAIREVSKIETITGELLEVNVKGIKIRYDLRGSTYTEQVPWAKVVSAYKVEGTNTMTIQRQVTRQETTYGECIAQDDFSVTIKYETRGKVWEEICPSASHASIYTKESAAAGKKEAPAGESAATA